MKTNTSHKLSFSVNNWTHLYSLQKAISYSQQLTGRNLTISGQLLNHDFLNNIDTKITLNFLQSDIAPDYPLSDNGTHILGHMLFSNLQLSTDITVDRQVFEELRKNLMEYADIEGIHIMISLEVLSQQKNWQPGEQLNIIQLDYAMKGDN